MEDTPPPYDEILEKRDRSWSLRLLDRLLTPDISDHELGEIVWVLPMLEDPRCAQPLHDILLDTSHPSRIRDAAGAILRLWGATADDATLRLWWNSDDEILQLHALISMGAEQADIIEQVAADPQHRYYRNAIWAMDFGFELRRHQKLKITALSHANAEVRETAAHVLVWDEPARAEDALIAATYDVVPAVAEAACNSLQYYPTQKTFRRLGELRAHEDDTVRAKVEDSYQAIRRRFNSELTTFDKAVRKHIRRWLAPIWDELAFTKKELKREKLSGSWRDPKHKKITARRVLKLVNDPDTSPHVLSDLFHRSDWRSIPAKKREKLTATFLQHPDSIVRNGATVAFEAWRDQDSLIRLLSDPEFFVRKSAMYRLGETPPYRSKIARIVWKHLKRKDAVGTHGEETLRTYFHHAKRKKAVPRLMKIALDPDRPAGLRHEAISLLDPFHDQEELLQLMKLLEEEPPLTWAIHIELLDAAEWLRITPPALARLRAVDHLDMQVAITPFL